MYWTPFRETSVMGDSGTMASSLPLNACSQGCDDDKNPREDIHQIYVVVKYLMYIQMQLVDGKMHKT